MIYCISNSSNPRVPHIPNTEQLEAIFPKDVCDKMNWASESSTFGLFIQLLDLPVYRSRVLLGVTYSAGGISANLVSEKGRLFFISSSLGPTVFCAVFILTPCFLLSISVSHSPLSTYVPFLYFFLVCFTFFIFSCIGYMSVLLFSTLLLNSIIKSVMFCLALK